MNGACGSDGCPFVQGLGGLRFVFFHGSMVRILDAVRLGAGFRAFICCFLLGYASSETRHDPLVLGSVAAVRLGKNILYQVN